MTFLTKYCIPCLVLILGSFHLQGFSQAKTRANRLVAIEAGLNYNFIREVNPFGVSAGIRFNKTYIGCQAVFSGYSSHNKDFFLHWRFMPWQNTKRWNSYSSFSIGYGFDPDNRWSTYTDFYTLRAALGMQFWFNRTFFLQTETGASLLFRNVHDYYAPGYEHQLFLNPSFVFQAGFSVPIKEVAADADDPDHQNGKQLAHSIAFSAISSQKALYRPYNGFRFRYQLSLNPYFDLTGSVSLHLPSAFVLMGENISQMRLGEFAVGGRANPLKAQWFHPYFELAAGGGIRWIPSWSSGQLQPHPAFNISFGNGLRIGKEEGISAFAAVHYRWIEYYHFWFSGLEETEVEAGLIYRFPAGRNKQM